MDASAMMQGRARACGRWLALAGAFALPIAAQPASQPGAAGSPAPTVSQGLTLPQLVALARNQDPRTAQARAQVEAARGKRDEAVFAFFPTFETTIALAGPTSEARIAGGNTGQIENLTPSSTGFGQLGIAVKATTQAIVPLYTFGKYDSGTSAARHAVVAQEALLDRARDQAAFDVTRSYWGFQSSHGGLTAIESVRQRLADARKRAQQLLEDGSDQLSKADLTRLDYLAEEAEVQHAAVVKNETLALTGIKLLVGVRPDEPLVIDRQDLPAPPGQPEEEAMLQLGLAQRPEAKAAAENVAARQALVDLERARYFPDLGIALGYTYNYQSNASSPVTPFAVNPNARGGYVALALRGTFDFPQKIARVHQHEAALREAQALLRGAESLLRLELRQALGDLAEARTRAVRYAKEASIGKQLLVQAGLAFDSGLGSAQDLVVDVFMYSRAEGERLRALFDAQLAWAALEKAVGGTVQRPPPEPPPPPPPGPAEGPAGPNGEQGPDRKARRSRVPSPR